MAKIHNSNVGKRTDIRTPQQLYPLAIDKELDKLKEKAQKKRRSILKGKQFEETKRKFEKVLKKNACRTKAQPM